MPDIPAICDRCGTVFRSGFFVENVSHLTLNGNRAGPCPACGGMGHVPDGVFDVVGDVIKLLQGPERTVAEFQQLAMILQTARERKASPEEVRNTIQRDLPGLRSIGDILPRTRSDLYALIAILLTALSMILSAREEGNAATIEINNVYNTVFQQTPTTQTPDSLIEPIREDAQSTKVGRNEPCPCGSGQKFKRCHGKAY